MSDNNSRGKLSKSEQTKRAITDAFLDLIPSKKWDKISVKEICAAADITRGTFYQYYSDIYDLMEQIETALTSELTRLYSQVADTPDIPCFTEMFEKKFDYAPPQYLKVWLKFCKKNRRAIAVLLDPKNGDTYFVQKLKKILAEHLGQMMDHDGMPQDALRSHFIKIFVEMHFLTARFWLDAPEEELLSTTEIINLLNVMRVGANYLHYRQAMDPNFDIRMTITDDAD